MSTSAIHAQAHDTLGVGIAPQSMNYTTPVQQYSLPQAVTGYSVTGQHSIYVQPSLSTTYAAPAAISHILQQTQAAGAPVPTYSAPPQPISYTSTAAPAAMHIAQPTYATATSTSANDQPVSTTVHSANPSQEVPAQESIPVVTYQTASHPQEQYSTSAVMQYSALAAQLQSPLAQPPCATTQVSSEDTQPAATYVHDPGQSVLAAEQLQTMTYQVASTHGVPLTYHATMPSCGAPTIQTHSPVIYPHQYQQTYLMSPHPGLPTTQSMVAYPIRTGIPQPNPIQPESASQAHAAVAPEELTEATTSTAVMKEPTTAETNLNQSEKASKTAKKTCC